MKVLLVVIDAATPRVVCPAIRTGRLPVLAALAAAGDMPGYEFEVPGGEAHLGGASHGALHALDSLSPVIIAGANITPLPRRMRSVDILPLCMEILGMPMRYRTGAKR